MVNVQFAKVILDWDLFLLMVCSGLGHTKSSDFLVFFLYCKYSTRSIVFAFTNKIQMTEGVSCVAGLRSQVSSFSSTHICIFQKLHEKDVPSGTREVVLRCEYNHG